MAAPAAGPSMSACKPKGSPEIATSLVGVGVGVRVRARVRVRVRVKGQG